MSKQRFVDIPAEFIARSGCQNDAGILNLAFLPQLPQNMHPDGGVGIKNLSGLGVHLADRFRCLIIKAVAAGELTLQLR